MSEDGWTANDIIQALDKRGIKLYNLIKQYQLEQGGRINYYQLESIIADVLNVPIKDLWPLRYD